MNSSMDKLVQSFYANAANSKQHLQHMLDLITAGKVPEKESVDLLDTSIADLRGKYVAIKQYATEHITKDEMPVDGSSITAYIEAVANSESVQYQKLLDEVKETLESFIAVRSLVEAYSSALKLYQEQAAKILNYIKDVDKIVDLDEVTQDIVAPKTFVEALSCPDFDSEENIQILESLGEHYSVRICNGVGAGKYYIDHDALNVADEIAITDEKVVVVEDCGEMVATAEVVNEQSAGEDTKSRTLVPANDEEPVFEPNLEDSTENNEDQGEENKDIVEKARGYTEDDDEPAGDSDFVKSLLENNCILPLDYNFGRFTSEINLSAESKKISSSIFINDMRKGHEKAEKVIIKELDSRGYITRELLVDVKGCPEGPIDSALDYLVRRGYLRKYGIEPSGTFYCPSHRLKRALTYKESCRFAGIRQRTMGDFGETIEDSVASAATRLAFMKVTSEAVKRITNTGETGFSEESTIATDAFVRRIHASESKNYELSVGAFWSTTEECDSILGFANKHMEECETITRFTVAGATFDIANDLMKSILNHLNAELLESELYIYSLYDDEFRGYLGDSNETTDISAVIENQNTNESLEEVTNEETPNEERINGTEQLIEKDGKNGENNLIEEMTSMSDKGEEESLDVMYSMLVDGDYYAATAYAKACSLMGRTTSLSYRQLAYALNDPMAHCSYSTENVFNMITRSNAYEDALVIAIAIRTFYSNQVRFDYNIKAFYEGIKNYALLDNYPALSKVVYSLMEFKNDQSKGIAAYTGLGSKSQAEVDREILALRREAAIFYENFVAGRKKETASQKRFVETKKLIFSANSEMGEYIKSIVDDDKDLMPLIRDFLEKRFFKEDSTISESNIDGDMLWDYIVEHWEKAGDNMMYRRHADLMSHLRNNITNQTMRAVQILARWCAIVEQANGHTEDDGAIAFKRIKKFLLENLSEAISQIEKDFGEKEYSLEERAGVSVLCSTLKDMKTNVEGNANEHVQKYYYAQFLLTDEIVLDESFIPDFDMHSCEIHSLQPDIRILRHIKKLKSKAITMRDRLTEILDEQGDDYGVASLIVEYLSETTSEDDVSSLIEMIESGEVYAKETAVLRKDDFIGELELAQSYGQIDNSIEDKKEKILQIVDSWYEWALETSNYGFFKKIMDAYLAEIKESAKSREADLLEQLNSFKKSDISGLSKDTKDKRIAKICSMIKDQNYTVAEDLLARATILEDGREEAIEEDFLKEFMDNYEDYYHPVATHQSNFASLVSSRTRNKEERGAKRLADNWLPGGSNLGKDKLLNLLSCFGFKVAEIKQQSPIGKIENFVVQTVEPVGGQRNHYTHPIAAFGSSAAIDGFRVVCINGVYDADGLIDVMKQIGNAKHTLILFDHALSKSERRRLARKTKNALGDKLFAVVDRTVMMFLVRNFDETKIARMLISLVTPFGYYQPYVWESANVMPPEIFMGRKHELERIKSSTGANIVYGGRQLGKSALLKKAKDDIDRDENGDRAIYIEIKGLNYKDAAKKIGHELYDQFILDEDIDTNDWDVLARTIRRRLQIQDKSKQIPYLLLLLDEADAFIESCEEVNYKPFDSLKEIQSIGVGRFKFVIAGLHNIVRFKREAALSNNSVLTHLEAMTVKPFNTSEARELMEIPLHYLGLRFPKEKESLITLILATTNYFPGLIQMYCAKLLDAMRSKDYAGYDEVDTPVYEVSEEHIKKVLADREFNEQIREKFFITLKLDGDHYYYLIALLMAYLYHTNGYSDGYSAKDIQSAGTELDISKIVNLDIEKLAAFMEELRELNVLRSTDEKKYLFTRFTFFQMMGTNTDVEDKLVEYMGE